ncbi:MAG: flavodoxin family protein [Phycisphaerae bacterium]|jgi:multimeric flavodoxin WrbA|nr:flavodoxin family protein [Phycisphaerae bacterium]
MKVVAFNGSGRKNGNTAMLIEHAFKPLGAAGIETEMLQLAGNTIRGCTACYKCVENKDQRCAITGDIINDCIAKMIEADGIILASPTYVADVSAELKALIDRGLVVTRVNGNLLKRKVGAAIVAVRRGGAIHAYDSINHFFLISQMIVPGSSYWNIGMGRNIGDVQEDAEGIETMTDLGENMAWLLGRIAD